MIETDFIYICVQVPNGPGGLGHTQLHKCFHLGLFSNRILLQMNSNNRLIILQPHINSISRKKLATIKIDKKCVWRLYNA